MARPKRGDNVKVEFVEGGKVKRWCSMAWLDPYSKIVESEKWKSEDYLDDDYEPLCLPQFQNITSGFSYWTPVPVEFREVLYVQCDPLWRSIKAHVVYEDFLKNWRISGSKGVAPYDALIITYTGRRNCHILCQKYNLYLNNAYKIYKPLEEILSVFSFEIRKIADINKITMNTPWDDTKLEEINDQVEIYIDNLEEDWKKINKKREERDLSSVKSKDWERSKLKRVLIGLVKREKARVKWRLPLVMSRAYTLEDCLK